MCAFIHMQAISHRMPCEKVKIQIQTYNKYIYFARTFHSSVCCSVSQRVAVCCSVLQRVVVCCGVLRCVVAFCSVAMCCSALQRVGSVSL